MYPSTQLLIDGKWGPAASGRTIPVLNPATEEQIGTVAHAGTEDLDRALAAARKGFEAWRKVSPYDRAKVMRKAADLMRARADEIARLMTLEQGKPLAQSKIEAMLAGDIIEWFAEEGRRTYGRVVPARMPNVHQLVLKEPVGPVAAFTPWNFPINQAVRKTSAALEKLRVGSCSRNRAFSSTKRIDWSSSTIHTGFMAACLRRMPQGKGIKILKSVCPGALSTSIVPWCCCTKVCANVRPKPEPPSRPDTRG
jgi:hypothetical protein